MLVLLAGAAAAQLARAAPAVALTPLLPAAVTVPGPLPQLPWPSQGEAGVALEGIGSLGSSGGNRPLPIASVTKVMTAYVVLTDHPLSGTAAGPGIQVSAADVAAYRSEAAQQDSVAAVAAGEVLSERQALAAMLIPSADNVARLLARWDAGSLSAFTARMNAAARRLGLDHTHFAGPSGLDPGSVSTPADLIRLGEVALTLPTLRALVAEPQVTLPVAGTLFNYNALVGHGGVIGIKTGSTPASGGSLLFAARTKIQTAAGPRTLTAVGAVLDIQGAQPLAAALAAARRLIDAVPAAVRLVTVRSAGAPVGLLRAAWRPGPLTLRLGAPVRFLGWGGLRVHVSWAPQPRREALAAGQPVAALTFQLGAQRQTAVVTSPAAIGAPSLRWRLLRR